MNIDSHDPGPDRTVLQLIFGYLASAAIGAVARLGIADHLAQQPRTAGELAVLTGVDESGLQRTLRYLPHLTLEDGTPIYDRLGGDFTLLRIGPNPPIRPRFCVLLPSGGSRWKSSTCHPIRQSNGTRNA